MTALRLPRAAVVGIDLGGAVALKLAALRKERVSHLALINSLAPDSVPSADLRALTRNTARFALRVAGSGLLGVASLLTPLLEESVSDPAAHMPPRLVARYLAPYVGQDGVNHLLALARAVRAEDLSDIDPASIRVPTLVVRGDDDIWLDGDVAGRLAASLPNGQLARISGVGRLIPEEAPDQLTSLLLDFVEGRLEGRPEAETRSLS
jgi:pimeloyl-ACP methyl ester carboxylesterase